MVVIVGRVLVVVMEVVVMTYAGMVKIIFYDLMHILFRKRVQL